MLFGDNVVPKDLKESFIKAAAPLEDVPDNKKDWHPDSEEQILNLVDPSLYPYQYEVTPRIPDSEHVGLEAQYRGNAERTIAPAFDKEKDTIKSHFEDWGFSKRSQWLPSVFDVSKDGEVTIESYINNLHPVHFKDLYKPIGDIFACAIPAINASLTRYASPQRVRIDPFDNKHGLYKSKRPSVFKDPEAYLEWREGYVFAPLKIEWKGVPTDDVQIDVRGKKLKVITKMFNIVLTPEKPRYFDPIWYVEGQINEDIVCTVLYYYDTENITSSELGFQVALDKPKCEEDDDRGCEAVFGLNDNESPLWDVGATEAVEDRIIVFPNMLLHRETTFSLADETKSGHSKILCFYIVDPNNDKVVTTDQVPPQQADWWKDEVTATPSMLTHKLPPELLKRVLGEVDSPMSLEQAKKVRQELIDERKDNNERSEDALGVFSPVRLFRLSEDPFPLKL